MKLVVFSHKPCWHSSSSPSQYATDGGFPFQMDALAELFDATTLVLPLSATTNRIGEMPIKGHNLSIVTLTDLAGKGLARKARLPFWFIRNFFTLVREARVADAVHTPIPGDVGTVGIFLALALKKPLFVRHGGNWFVQKTVAESFWRWFMERTGGGRNVMMATGGAAERPSRCNPNVRWIFSTTLTEKELFACSNRRTRPEGGRARLIIVCRQEVGKGTEIVIESLPLIMQNLPGAKLDVVGGGNALEHFKKLSATFGVSDRVTFHGRLKHAEVIKLLQRADLFCYPTVSEGFPKVVLEALACGLPVITTRVSVLPRLIETGGGVLIDERTATEMARVVTDCLSSAHRYSAMSEQALQTAKDFTLERWKETVGEHLRASWGPLRADA